MRKHLFVFEVFALLCAMVSCEVVDDDIDRHTSQLTGADIGLDEVAGILSALPIAPVHLQEVHSAVRASAANGYDEEYTMRDLFESPGAGVGDDKISAKSVSLVNPMRNLIREHLGSAAVKGAGNCPCKKNPELFIKALMESDVQIYWPFSELWDGVEYPIITFDPMDGTEANIGYRIKFGTDKIVEEVVVDEKLALEHPVWVVNRNSDAEFMTLELLRKQNPEWGQGGGSIVVKPSEVAQMANSSTPLKSLILKDFTMKRNFDTWFAGASEFFVKAGYVKDFTASTEAELKLYNPSITDFMVVVKRSQLGKPQPFNAMLITDWSPQMDACAFMITEDDGGTRTEWKCHALVRIASKSYGFEVLIPFNSRDDVVWRGQLSNRWLESGKEVVSHFGDVDVTFSVI